MQQPFFRFPHTPHLIWLGTSIPRNDKLLEKIEVTTLLNSEVIIEEKIDGANLGISVDAQGNLQIQNRGQYLKEPFSGQFRKLKQWLAQHHYDLVNTLTHNLILFGEWCAACHSVYYEQLPDWFLVFDVYDYYTHQFWSTTRRNELVKTLNLNHVSCLFKGKITEQELKKLLDKQSCYSYHKREGLIIRQESEHWLNMRAKLVAPNFIQQIDEHWTKKNIIWNHLAVNDN
ncbi:ATP-dependent DNA ligase [Beggiatoa alba B18LD]|uniref:ATP-dependent DNA ligase n=1 Tax=Beggiatoa alba B18LD TaxID=395493 RepID=I3CI05_9GAMM|nr:RNA ligase family protein [Beggiatoa alba]EIJ43248.1 ATP-dependent DNA ligase [Beggiatoa alba B18LD]